MDLESELLTVQEAMKILKVGRNTCYNLIHSRQIPSVRFGKIIRIPKKKLLEQLQRCETEK